VQIVIESLLENTTTQIIYLPQQNLLYSQTKLNVLDLGLLCIFGESGGLEGAIRRIGWHG
jgi:hypothetical protein